MFSRKCFLRTAVILLLLLCMVGVSSAAWNSESYVIMESDASMSNATIKVPLDYTSGMNSAFRDVRFVYPNGTNIQYYVENVVNGSNATFYLKMNVVEGRQYVKVFYNNTSATKNVSNITGMFLYRINDTATQKFTSNTTFYSGNFTHAEWVAKPVAVDKVLSTKSIKSTSQAKGKESTSTGLVLTSGAMIEEDESVRGGGGLLEGMLNKTNDVLYYGFASKQTVAPFTSTTGMTYDGTTQRASEPTPDSLYYTGFSFAGEDGESDNISIKSLLIYNSTNVILSDTALIENLTIQSPTAKGTANFTFKPFPPDAQFTYDIYETPPAPYEQSITFTAGMTRDNCLLNLTIPRHVGMKADYSDLRFKYPDNGTDMPYYISSSNSTAAEVSIRMNMTAGENEITMYFGNEEAEAMSDADSIYIYRLYNESGIKGYFVTLFNNTPYTAADVIYTQPVYTGSTDRRVCGFGLIWSNGSTYINSPSIVRSVSSNNTIFSSGYAAGGGVFDLYSSTYDGDDSLHTFSIRLMDESILDILSKTTNISSNETETSVSYSKTAISTGTHLKSFHQFNINPFSSLISTFYEANFYNTTTISNLSISEPSASTHVATGTTSLANATGVSVNNIVNENLKGGLYFLKISDTYPDRSVGTGFFEIAPSIENLTVQTPVNRGEVNFSFNPYPSSKLFDYELSANADFSNILGNGTVAEVNPSGVSINNITNVNLTGGTYYLRIVDTVTSATVGSTTFTIAANIENLTIQSPTAKGTANFTFKPFPTTHDFRYDISDTAGFTLIKATGKTATVNGTGVSVNNVTNANLTGGTYYIRIVDNVTNTSVGNGTFTINASIDNLSVATPTEKGKVNFTFTTYPTAKTYRYDLSAQSNFGTIIGTGTTATGNATGVSINNITNANLTGGTYYLRIFDTVTNTAVGSTTFTIAANIENLTIQSPTAKGTANFTFKPFPTTHDFRYDISDTAGFTLIKATGKTATVNGTGVSVNNVTNANLTGGTYYIRIVDNVTNTSVGNGTFTINASIDNLSVATPTEKGKVNFTFTTYPTAKTYRYDLSAQSNFGTIIGTGTTATGNATGVSINNITNANLTGGTYYLRIFDTVTNTAVGSTTFTIAANIENLTIQSPTAKGTANFTFKPFPTTHDFRYDVSDTAGFTLIKATGKTATVNGTGVSVNNVTNANLTGGTYYIRIVDNVTNTSVGNGTFTINASIDNLSVATPTEKGKVNFTFTTYPTAKTYRYDLSAQSNFGTIIGTGTTATGNATGVSINNITNANLTGGTYYLRIFDTVTNTAVGSTTFTIAANIENLTIQSPTAKGTANFTFKPFPTTHDFRYDISDTAGFTLIKATGKTATVNGTGVSVNNVTNANLTGGTYYIRIVDNVTNTSVGNGTFTINASIDNLSVATPTEKGKVNFTFTTYPTAKTYRYDLSAQSNFGTIIGTGTTATGNATGVSINNITNANLTGGTYYLRIFDTVTNTAVSSTTFTIAANIENLTIQSPTAKGTANFTFKPFPTTHDFRYDISDTAGFTLIKATGKTATVNGTGVSVNNVTNANLTDGTYYIRIVDNVTNTSVGNGTFTINANIENLSVATPTERGKVNFTFTTYPTAKTYRYDLSAQSNFGTIIGTGTTKTGNATGVSINNITNANLTGGTYYLRIFDTVTSATVGSTSFTIDVNIENLTVVPPFTHGYVNFTFNVYPSGKLLRYDISDQSNFGNIQATGTTSIGTYSVNNITSSNLTAGDYYLRIVDTVNNNTVLGSTSFTILPNIKNLNIQSPSDKGLLNFTFNPYPTAKLFQYDIYKVDSYEQSIVFNAGMTRDNCLLNITIPKQPEMNSDYSDLRFKYPDNGTDMPYYISSSNSTAAEVSIRMNMTAGENEITMYFGNEEAEAMSDADSIYIYRLYNESGINGRNVTLFNNTPYTAADVIYTQPVYTGIEDVMCRFGSIWSNGSTSPLPYIVRSVSSDNTFFRSGYAVGGNEFDLYSSTYDGDDYLHTFSIRLMDESILDILSKTTNISSNETETSVSYSKTAILVGTHLKSFQRFIINPNSLISTFYEANFYNTTTISNLSISEPSASTHVATGTTSLANATGVSVNNIVNENLKGGLYFLKISDTSPDRSVGTGFFEIAPSIENLTVQTPVNRGEVNFSFNPYPSSKLFDYELSANADFSNILGNGTVAEVNPSGVSINNITNVNLTGGTYYLRIFDTVTNTAVGSTSFEIGANIENLTIQSPTAKGTANFTFKPFPTTHDFRYDISDTAGFTLIKATGKTAAMNGTGVSVNNVTNANLTGGTYYIRIVDNVTNTSVGNGTFTINANIENLAVATPTEKGKVNFTFTTYPTAKTYRYDLSAQSNFGTIIGTGTTATGNATGVSINNVTNVNLTGGTYYLRIVDTVTSATVGSTSFEIGASIENLTTQSPTERGKVNFTFTTYPTAKTYRYDLSAQSNFGTIIGTGTTVTGNATGVSINNVTNANLTGGTYYLRIVDTVTSATVGSTTFIIAANIENLTIQSPTAKGTANFTFKPFPTTHDFRYDISDTAGFTLIKATGKTATVNGTGVSVNNVTNANLTGGTYYIRIVDNVTNISVGNGTFTINANIENLSVATPTEKGKVNFTFTTYPTSKTYRYDLSAQSNFGTIIGTGTTATGNATGVSINNVTNANLTGGTYYLRIFDTVTSATVGSTSFEIGANIDNLTVITPTERGKVHFTFEPFPLTYQFHYDISETNDFLNIIVSGTASTINATGISDNIIENSNLTGGTYYLRIVDLAKDNTVGSTSFEIDTNIADLTIDRPVTYGKLNFSFTQYPKSATLRYEISKDQEFGSILFTGTTSTANANGVSINNISNTKLDVGIFYIRVVYPPTNAVLGTDTFTIDGSIQDFTIQEPVSGGSVSFSLKPFPSNLSLRYDISRYAAFNSTVASGLTAAVNGTGVSVNTATHPNLTAGDFFIRIVNTETNTVMHTDTFTIFSYISDLSIQSPAPVGMVSFSFKPSPLSKLFDYEISNQSNFGTILTSGTAAAINSGGISQNTARSEQLTGGTYYLRIKDPVTSAIVGNGTFVINPTISNLIVQTPTETGKANFTFSQNPTNVQFQYQISKQSNFASVLVSGTTATANASGISSNNISNALIDGGTFYLRIVDTVNNNTVLGSTSFTINSVVTNLNVKTPTESGKVDFSFKQTPTTKTFQYQISRNEQFTQMVTSGTTAAANGTGFSNNNVTNGNITAGTYYLRIMEGNEVLATTTFTIFSYISDLSIQSPAPVGMVSFSFKPSPLSKLFDYEISNQSNFGTILTSGTAAAINSGGISQNTARSEQLTGGTYYLRIKDPVNGTTLLSGIFVVDTNIQDFTIVTPVQEGNVEFYFKANPSNKTFRYEISNENRFISLIASGTTANTNGSGYSNNNVTNPQLVEGNNYYIRIIDTATNEPLITNAFYIAPPPPPAPPQFEMNYGKGMIDLFKNTDGGYSLTAMIKNSIGFLNTATFGVLLGAVVLMVLWLIYQKTDSVVSIYAMAVLGTYLLRLTVFREMSTIFFYIVVLAVTIVVYSLLKGRN